MAPANGPAWTAVHGLPHAFHVLCGCIGSITLVDRILLSMMFEGGMFVFVSVV